jgi:hypothetical protein
MAGRERTRLVSAKGGLARAHARFGWSARLVFLLFGYSLEALEGFKVGGFLREPMRHEMWALSHFHGAFLAMLNLVYVAFAESERLDDPRRLAASRALRIGALLLPLGFFLGGLVHYEGDPGPGIFLVPIGALFLLYAVGLHAAAAWKRPS